MHFPLQNAIVINMAAWIASARSNLDNAAAGKTLTVVVATSAERDSGISQRKQMQK